MNYSKQIALVAMFLKQHATTLQGANEIAKTVAEKAFEMRHLYQDMGFSSRKELNDFMTLHYPALAAARPSDIRWKKYIFDCVGLVAPACVECKDMHNCFKCDLLEVG